jgi:chaperonin GroES
VKIKPLGDRILVELAKEDEVIKGGIIIPDSAKEKPQEGKVLAVGTGKLDKKGKKLPFNVKEGDRVLMPKYGGSEVKVDDKKYTLIKEDEILGVLGR